MKNIITFDLEDYFQVESFKHLINYSEWDNYSLRVVESTRTILEILDRYSVEATFFVLGWIAERCPELIQEISTAGHEIASHGYAHKMIADQTPQEFDLDIKQSISVIRDILGPGYIIRGYRAPCFSVVNSTKWALKILKSNGFEYDSSIFPIGMHDRYGIKDSPRFSWRTDEGLLEIPPSTICLANRNWPVAGGGYFRLLPLCLTKQAINKINREGYPATVYLHPWEFDPSQPKIRGLSKKAFARHFINIDKTGEKLSNLFASYEFTSVRKAYSSQLN